jgi:hypothetical protein
MTIVTADSCAAAREAGVPIASPASFSVSGKSYRGNQRPAGQVVAAAEAPMAGSIRTPDGHSA